MSANLKRTAEERDADLEAQIDIEYEAMVGAKTDAESREHFLAMSRLIRQRSQTQIERMELERRIAIRAARESQS